MVHDAIYPVICEKLLAINMVTLRSNARLGTWGLTNAKVYKESILI